MKRFLALILALMLTLPVMTGCVLFEHDNEYDMKQVVAQVNPIKDSGKANQYEKIDGSDEYKYDEKGERIPLYTTDANGNKLPMTKDVEFASTTKLIYKIDLINELNSRGEELLKEMSIEAALKLLNDQLVQRELIFIEADRLIAFNEIDFGLTERNKVKKLVYDAIDSELYNIKNEILSERDEDKLPTKPTSNDETKTTYPVKAQEKPVVVRDTKVWEPNVLKYPGIPNDKDTEHEADLKSLEREALRRFVFKVNANARDNFRLTPEDKTKFDKDMENIKAIEKDPAKGLPYVYPILGDTHIMYKLVGESAEKQVKLELLENYIQKSAKASDEDVTGKFQTTLATQKREFVDATKYKTAAEDSTKTILYTPNSDMFYVKHILFKFSTEQEESLKKVMADTTKTKAEKEQFRSDLAKQIKIYKHVNGEDDKSRVYTLNEAYNEVSSAMTPLVGNPYEADRKFTDLIYDFNMDPGIFNNAKGYAVAPKPTDPKEEKFVIEFATAARKLKAEGNVGDISEPVLTDNGYHVLYLASLTQKDKEVSINEFTSPGNYETYFEVFEKQVLDANKSTAFNAWQGERITFYTDVAKNIVVKYPERYKNLYTK